MKFQHLFKNLLKVSFLMITCDDIYDSIHDVARYYARYDVITVDLKVWEDSRLVVKEIYLFAK